MELFGKHGQRIWVFKEGDKYFVRYQCLEPLWHDWKREQVVEGFYIDKCQICEGRRRFDRGRYVYKYIEHPIDKDTLYLIMKGEIK